MNKRTLLLTTLPLISGLAVGSVYLLMPPKTPDFTDAATADPASSVAFHSSLQHQWDNSNSSYTALQDQAIHQPTANKIEKLPGIFRGDWGETPVYMANDRVNFEGAAYLSLLDDNQNQPPSLSPAYWQLVKAAELKNAADCLLIGPNAHLDSCNFTQENSLKDRDLQGADLSQTQLSGELGLANLSGANLSGATVIGSLRISPDTQMARANLSGLQSDGNNPLIAEAANMNRVNFSNANLYGAKLKAANMSGASFKGATLTGADMRSSQLGGADLSKTDLTYASLSGASLTKASLSKADLTEANLSKTNFSAANLRSANLAGSNLTEANLSGADLSGVNLMDAKGTNSALVDSNTNFTAAICPDGATVDGSLITTCIGHGF